MCTVPASLVSRVSALFKASHTEQNHTNSSGSIVDAACRGIIGFSKKEIPVCSMRLTMLMCSLCWSAWGNTLSAQPLLKYIQYRTTVGPATILFWLLTTALRLRLCGILPCTADASPRGETQPGFQTGHIEVTTTSNNTQLRLGTGHQLLILLLYPSEVVVVTMAGTLKSGSL